MSRIVIIADARLGHVWSSALARDGHDVVCVSDSLSFQSLFEGDSYEIVIIDIDRPDWGETMLIPQVRAAWPDSKIVAVVANYDFRNSAVYQMGLWTPDQVLLKPLAIRLLCTTVSFLWAQIRSQEIREIVTGGFFGDNPIAKAPKLASIASDPEDEHRLDY
ncbi:MAG: hypothetical protein AAF674_03080 [Pseudomonadota bacterium]